MINPALFFATNETNLTFSCGFSLSLKRAGLEIQFL
jgi:hypothetical protein